MLKINKTVTASPEQLEIVIEGMRNPLNSWDKMDSSIEHLENPDTMNEAAWQFHLGEADHKCMTRLNNGGPVEAKYRRMIPVWVTLTAPLYWWKEFDTYKVGTVCNSCSTMHKITAKEFTMDDFSAEHLVGFFEQKALHNSNATDLFNYRGVMEETIDALNNARKNYIAYGELLENQALNNEARSNLVHGRKVYWHQMIQLLPTSYNQKRTIMLNYEVLVGIYKSRRHHKLGEWHTFCDWIEKLPYSDLITGEVVGDGEKP